ncbi:MAG: arsenate reductase ArsC [Actinobacteria bacterium]|nr:arsenate reductase ArsC [Actinomycetota bacterium]
MTLKAQNQKHKIAFICTGNSCRSQMAEGFAKYLAAKTGVGDILEIYSAGTNPKKVINPDAIKVMSEAGIDISNQHTKLINDIPSFIDTVITMGCIDGCPAISHNYFEDWDLEDPDGKSIEKFREVRGKIEKKTKDLIIKIKNML